MYGDLNVDLSERFPKMVGIQERALRLAKDPVAASAWKSSLRTAKRPRLDRTGPVQDRKFPGPQKTKTAVRFSVFHKSGNSKTIKNRLRLVLTGLYGSKG
jgi:hypothetical protein